VEVFKSSEGDSLPVGERADIAGAVGDKVDEGELER